MNDLDQLNLEKDGLRLYSAGLPGFPGNFSRDSILSAILMQNAPMLRDQLIFCARKQGKSKNRFTGEEPGKIFHELPGVKIRKLSTEYNACDTTALFLIGHEIYKKMTGKNDLLNDHIENIENAKNYIFSHIKHKLFLETPKHCGSDRFALNVTYWKDSEMPDRENGTPTYPVAYTLSHIQNLRALKSASFLLHDSLFQEIADDMLVQLKKFLIDRGRNIFYLARDAEGPIVAVSSDMLHSLFYLERGDLEKDLIKGILENSVSLETKMGYRALSEEDSRKVGDIYHSKTIWPFEQAIINIGARKFGLNRIEKISSRIINYLDTNPEIFIIRDGLIEKGGNDPQLWTIAAKKYFNSNRKGIFP